jgi:hypothetical protein
VGVEGRLGEGGREKEEGLEGGKKNFKKLKRHVRKIILMSLILSLILMSLTLALALALALFWVGLGQVFINITLIVYNPNPKFRAGLY